MSGVTPLVDTLLATRLGQRLDLLPLKPQVEVAGPGPIQSIDRVENDVRLPSREALQRQLGVELHDGRPAQLIRARSDGAVTLSTAARAVSAILNLPVGTMPSVRGTVPLQPDIRLSPAVSVLTARLARTVSESGLFYESHLRQYTTGTRELAQLVREPQAGIPFSPSALSIGDPDASLSFPVAVASVSDEAHTFSTPAATGRGAQSVIGVPANTPGVPSAVAPDKAVGHEPVGITTTYDRTGLPAHEARAVKDFSGHEPDAQVTHSLEADSTDSARAKAAVAVIHPDTAGLVRQQLEMLAVPVFRWSGEGWPNIPMDWEIRQEGGEQDEHAGDGSQEVAPAVWTSRMTLKLPVLGTVDVRLALAGTTLELRMTVFQESTATVLTQAGADLPQRFGAVGLELKALKIVSAASNTAPGNTEGNRDAG